VTNGRAPDLKALNDRIERMREEERTRIARELHDELGQLLTGIKLDFATVLRRLRELQAPGDVVDRIQSAVGQIDLGLAMVRRIAADLRPALLDHHDLGGAIEFEARRRSAQSGMQIDVQHPTLPDIAPELATGAFRIFQEALTNAIRHANATQISVAVDTTSDALVVTVSDNGIGATALGAKQEPALGVMGMRERAQALGGMVDISGTPGRGTHVCVTLPLRPTTSSR
jgi:signal transduction histidine kinase